MRIIKWLSLLCLAAVALGVQPAFADDQIYFCTSGPCTSAPGGTALGGETNLILNPGSFELGGSGSFTLDSPMLIIVAAYDGGTPSISFGAVTSEPAAIVGTYGLTKTTASYTSASTGSAYAQVGLASGGSESFANFTAADVANGIPAPTGTFFTLDVFAVPTSLVSGSPITLDVSGAAKGSFLLAYSCESTTDGSIDSACKSGKIGDNVFTNIGLLDANSVPEPSSLALLGLGVVGLLGLGLRRKQALA